MTARDRRVGMVVLALAALVAGWLMVVQPKRSTAAKLASSVQSEQSQLSAVDSKIAADEQSRAAFPSAYAQLAQLGEAVPQDDEVPSLLYELQSAAKAAGVDFESLEVAPSSGSSTATTAPGSATGTSAESSVVPPGVSVVGDGFDAEQFTLSFTGDFFNLSSFLQRIQNFVVANSSAVRVSGRLMTVNALALSPASRGQAMEADVSVTTYLLPGSQGLPAGTAAAGTAASAAPALDSTPGLAGLAKGAASEESGSDGGDSSAATAPAAAVSGSSIGGLSR